MTNFRWDETWHRLREWTSGQEPSERLAAQVLLHDGFTEIDPSHPLGGRDGGKDAICIKDGNRWAMAVYFPRGQQGFAAVEEKFVRDRAGAQVHQPYGIAFVTNQELTLAQRKSLVESARPNAVELYHLERIATVLDNPAMAEVRKQFLNVAYEEEPTATLGGRGGSTPAAGGGGGGAIGSGSRGGDGGPGGRVIFAGGQGRAPGAGGGGAGALGENMQGGQGGGGGDLVHVEVGPEELHELRLAGFQRIDLRVGKGGESGEQGEDTANFVTADGTILKSIVARGGRPGAAPKPLARSRDATVQTSMRGCELPA